MFDSPSPCEQLIFAFDVLFAAHRFSHGMPFKGTLSLGIGYQRILTGNKLDFLKAPFGARNTKDGSSMNYFDRQGNINAKRHLPAQENKPEPLMRCWAWES